MTRMRSRGFAAIGLVVLAGCSSGGPAPSSSAAGGGSSQAAASAAGGGGGATQAAGNGGGVSSIDACKLLTTDEIKSATGISVKAGVPQSTDSQVNCDWESEDGASSVGLTVATFDDSLWSAFSSAANAKPVSGFGDAAFTGVPHSGDLAVKVKGYEVDFAIVDFQLQPDKLVSDDEALAQTVLPRL